jgi:outer membrane receptor protein involved in Fe transport
MLAASVVSLAAVSAWADDGAPAIPIHELPPFPDVSADTAAMSEVSIYGANLADEETVVGASKREQSLGTVASAVTVLTSDQIRRYGYRTLAEALRSVAGLYVVDDRMVERIGVRGVQLLGDANTRILILIDSTPLNEPWSQFVDGSTALPVSLDDVARIEIIRGPVSSIYGTNAFLGIINIVTLEADKAAPATGRATIGTFGTFAGNAAFNSGDINRQIRGSVGYAHRIGESTTYPELDDAGLMGTTTADGAHSLFGSLAINFDRFFFQARAYDRLRELPGAPYESEIGSADNTNRDRHVVAELGYTHELSRRLTIAARVYGNRYDFASHLDYASGEFTTDATSLWYGGELRALADLFEQKNLLAVTAGAAIEATTTESTASTKPEAIETSFNIAGIYLDGTSEPNKWLAVTVGARFDRNSEFESKLSPRAALVLHKGDGYGLKLLYAEGFRNPSIFEAYYDDDARFSPALDATGDTALRPESIAAYEVVAFGRPLTGVKLRLSAWEWRMDDLLKRAEVFIPPPENALRLRYQNSGPLVSRGVEVESTYRDVAGRSAFLNASVSFTGRNCLDSDGFDNLTLDQIKGNCDARQNAPVLVAKAGASSQLLFEEVHLSSQVAYISERGTQDPDAPAPAYVGLDVIVYAPDLGGFDLTVGGRNLIGREEVPAQSDYNRTTPRVELLRVPGPGREVFARMGYRF